MNKILTLACSTFGDRIVDAVNMFANLPLDELAGEVDFMIIHQQGERSYQPSELPSELQLLSQQYSLRYLPLSGRGLTKSRNHGISNCQTRYMWVVDDDLEIYPQEIIRLCGRLKAAEEQPPAIMLESLDRHDNKRAKYPRDEQQLDDRQVLRVASFEMVLNSEFLVGQQLFFREDMGVGGNKITLGEESVLLAEIKQAGGKVLHWSIIICKHADVSTGMKVSLDTLYSKGVVIRRCFAGSRRFRFFIRDVWRLLKNRDSEFGPLNYRLKLIGQLYRGCYRAH